MNTDRGGESMIVRRASVADASTISALTAWWLPAAPDPERWTVGDWDTVTPATGERAHKQAWIGV